MRTQWSWTGRFPFVSLALMYKLQRLWMLTWRLNDKTCLSELSNCWPRNCGWKETYQLNKKTRYVHLWWQESRGRLYTRFTYVLCGKLPTKLKESASCVRISCLCARAHISWRHLLNRFKKYITKPENRRLTIFWPLSFSAVCIGNQAGNRCSGI